MYKATQWTKLIQENNGIAILSFFPQANVSSRVTDVVQSQVPCVLKGRVRTKMKNPPLLRGGVVAVFKSMGSFPTPRQTALSLNQKNTYILPF